MEKRPPRMDQSASFLVGMGKMVVGCFNCKKAWVSLGFYGLAIERELSAPSLCWIPGGAGGPEESGNHSTPPLNPMFCMYRRSLSPCLLAKGNAGTYRSVYPGNGSGFGTGISAVSSLNIWGCFHKPKLQQITLGIPFQNIYNLQNLQTFTIYKTFSKQKIQY